MSDPIPSAAEASAAADPRPSSRWTKIGRRRFIEEMRRSANVSRAADCAKVSRSDAFALRSDDAAFRAAWDEAECAAFDDFEEEVLRRARDGVDKPVYFGGKLCGTVRSYNDALALEILKVRRDRIGDRSAAVADDVDRGASPVEVIEDRLRRFEAAHAPDECDPHGGS
jgi:hypothetical protein